MSETNEDFSKEPELYELGYLLLPSITENDLGASVLAIKQVIEKRGGAVTEEGEVSLRPLCYPISKVREHKHEEFTQAYFGWCKFTLAPVEAPLLQKEYDGEAVLLRSLIMRASPTPAPRVIPSRSNSVSSEAATTHATAAIVPVAPVELSATSEAELDREIESMLKV